jgi:hypothetical protein
MNQIPKPIKFILGILVALSAIATSSLLIWSAFSTTISQALPKKCVEDGTYEPASTTLRTVKIPEFGLEVSIPENFRTLKRQNGAVEILHPDDYAFITCIASGGEGLGHGYYSEYITAIESKTIDEVIVERVANEATATPYNQEPFSGYLITLSGIAREGTSFIGTVGNSDRLFDISPSCDCDTDREDLTRLMARIRPMQ